MRQGGRQTKDRSKKSEKRENQGDVPLDKVLSDEESFIKTNHVLKTLSRHFHDNPKIYYSLESSLNILTKMKDLKNIMLNEKINFQALEEQLHQNLTSIKSFVGELSADQVKPLIDSIEELKKIIDHFYKDLEQNRVFSKGGDKSTGSQHLHTLGFNRIVNMISSSPVFEPKWMARTGRILILDNHQNTAQALDRRLSRENHKVTIAETQEEAFEILEAQPIEVFLVDYSVVKDNLARFLGDIQNEERIGYVPLIVVGAPENTEEIRHIIENGVGDYLAKPVNPILLKARVRAALEKKHAYEERMKRLQEMERTRIELETAIRDLPDGFAVFDQDNRLVMHNEKLFEYYPNLHNIEDMSRGGLTFEKIIEANVASGIYHFSNIGEDTPRRWIEEKRAYFAQPASQWEEVLVDGRILGITTYRTPDGGGALVAKDISMAKAHHQDLTFLAYHDPLTGLLNRKAFEQKLSQLTLERGQGTGKGVLSILFMDLDGFKMINDTHGHEVGDWILIQVAQRLYRCVRGNDSIARLGGDEFTIILHNLEKRDKITVIAKRIIKAVSEPYIRGNLSMKVGVSIGISMYDPGSDNGENLMKEADTAMYTVKQSGKGFFRFYDEGKDKK